MIILWSEIDHIDMQNPWTIKWGQVLYNKAIIVIRHNCFNDTCITETICAEGIVALNATPNPIHFNKMYRWVDEYEDFRTGEVYGGYERQYKRKKAIMYGENLPDEIAGKKIYSFYTSWKNNKIS